MRDFWIGIATILLVLGAGAASGGEVSDPAPAVRLTVLMDNNADRDGLETSWGFACLVETPDRVVLFDTGRDSDVLSSNVERLGLDLGAVEAVVISHLHGDHTGGMAAVLRANPEVTVYLPEGLEPGQAEKPGWDRARLIEQREAGEVAPGLWSTGRMGQAIREQALVVRTGEGLVVLTGCAHPGVVEILERVRADHPKETVHAVMGGFHLVRDNADSIAAVVASFRRLGVRHAAPTHCSGDLARDLFESEYGSDFVQVGAGSAYALRAVAPD